MRFLSRASLRRGYPNIACRIFRRPIEACILAAAIFTGTPFAQAQVTNGDFSAGNTGWTSAAPTNSTLNYTGGQLTATSDDNGGGQSRTIASQSIIYNDPGFLSFLLSSYTSTDVGRWDYPTVLIGTTYYWITTGGTLTTTAASGIDNSDTGIANVSGAHAFAAAGTSTIGFGVTAVDSQLGPGIAIWDNIAFQQLTQSPGAQTTPANTNLVLTGASAPSVATNSGAASISVTLTVTNGTLTLGSTAGITITGGSNNSSTVTFTGSPANINNAMAGLTYVPTPGFTGSAALTFAATGGGISDTDTIPITVTGTPAFTISKAVNATSITFPSTLTYTITIDNTGTVNLTSTVFTDLLTQNGASRALTTGPTLSGDANSNNILETTETWTYTATYNATQTDIEDGNDLLNTATFDTAETAPQSDTATTTIATNPALALTKNATLVKASGNTGTNAETGDTINYTYTVTNTGNLNIADVDISDVHSGSDPLPDPAHNVTITTDNGTTGDSPDNNADPTIWGTLAPLDVITFTASYIVTQTDFDNQ